VLIKATHYAECASSTTNTHHTSSLNLVRSRLPLAHCAIIATIIPHSSRSTPSLRISPCHSERLSTCPTKSGMSEYDRFDVKYVLAICSYCSRVRWNGDAAPVSDIAALQGYS